MKKLTAVLFTLFSVTCACAMGIADKVKTHSTSKQPVSIHNITLPVVPKPAGNYLPYQISGKHIYISQIAFNGNTIIGPGIINDDNDIPRGQLAARQTMLNILAVVKDAVGDLNQIEKIVRLEGFIAASPSFIKLAQIMNGASDVAVELLGERGLHARSAIGANVLPLNSAVEISAIIELKPTAKGDNK